jgi:hypothetical protein
MDAVRHEGDFEKELQRRGGYGNTHAASLTRADASAFTAAEATDALHAVRYALILALGRRTGVVLPVGWNREQPVWARWSAWRIDAYRDYGTWLDASIAAAQVAETAGRFLDAWNDPLHRDTLRYATSYYAQALALDHELGTAAAVSGLSLLGYSWLVEDKKLYSPTAWKKKNTESQVRSLLDECRIDTAVPVAFQFLQSAAHRLNATKTAGEADRDGLGSLIAMRNDVVHPTRKKREKWSSYEWTEACVTAVHFLELALLAYVGYRGQYHPRITDNRWLGYTEAVPWT